VVEHTRPISHGPNREGLTGTRREDQGGLLRHRVPLQQIAGFFSVPEPRVLVVTPMTRRDEGGRAGVDQLGPRHQPVQRRQVFRLVFPELNEERRKEFVKSSSTGPRKDSRRAHVRR